MLTGARCTSLQELKLPLNECPPVQLAVSLQENTCACLWPGRERRGREWPRCRCEGGNKGERAGEDATGRGSLGMMMRWQPGGGKWVRFYEFSNDGEDEVRGKDKGSKVSYTQKENTIYHAAAALWIWVSRPSTTIMMYPLTLSLPVLP